MSQTQNRKPNSTEKKDLDLLKYTLYFLYIPYDITKVDFMHSKFRLQLQFSTASYELNCNNLNYCNA